MPLLQRETLDFMATHPLATEFTGFESSRFLRAGVLQYHARLISLREYKRRLLVEWNI